MRYNVYLPKCIAKELKIYLLKEDLTINKFCEGMILEDLTGEIRINFDDELFHRFELKMQLSNEIEPLSFNVSSKVEEYFAFKAQEQKWNGNPITPMMCLSYYIYSYLGMDEEYEDYEEMTELEVVPIDDDTEVIEVYDDENHEALTASIVADIDDFFDGDEKELRIIVRKGDDGGDY